MMKLGVGFRPRISPRVSNIDDEKLAYHHFITVVLAWVGA
jgi:hypothetical protein